jgi:porin
LILFAGLGLADDSVQGESSNALKAGYDNDPGFGGPTSTTSQLEEDDTDKVTRLRRLDDTFSPWFDWKGRVQENIGLQFGIAYTGLYQFGDDAPSGVDDEAGLGILRLSGRWTLVNRDTPNKGSLVFSADNRHRYTDMAPADLGFATGYLGIPGTLFSDVDTILGDLNWQQFFNDANTGLIVGRYDPNDFFSVLGYANPWTSFQNLSILFDTSIALADYSTGIGIGHWFNDQWYGKVSVNDVNSTATDTKFFDDFDELYTTVEAGWSPSHEERYLKNIHVTLWHADKREHEGVGEAEGVSVGANWTWNSKWMVFGRAGFSDGSAPINNTSVTGGFIHYFANRSDLLGLAANWGDPADDSLDDQVSTELFYRVQLAENLAITPSIQWINNPAIGADDDDLLYGSVRLRLTF